jgi:ectoine hydroxylase-related dioxygenase (phytanoyl-CoA dioxygenase family)
LRKLTGEEIESYDRDGFVIVPEIFPTDELARINTEIDRLRSDPGEQDGQKYNIILQLGLRSPMTRAICSDERVLTLIEDIVKPGIAIYSAKMVEKPPHDDTICHWHQDDAYYQQNSLSDCRMSIWLPLADCDESNGCLWTVPGSHKRGLQPWEKRESGTCNLSFQDGTDVVDGEIPVHISAGDILLFHALTWHRSLPNHTDRTRRSFIVSYQDALAAKGNGPQHKILRAA